MTKAELKAFDKLIDNAAESICGKFFNAALTITDDVYLELLKKIRDRTNAMIVNAERISDKDYEKQ